LYNLANEFLVRQTNSPAVPNRQLIAGRCGTGQFVTAAPLGHSLSVLIVFAAIKLSTRNTDRKLSLIEYLDSD
jgi:hypothetical protein